uniref:hypothetical protein n=1 Tax=Infirmifilum uzonense TaxID=1550241 RepID=UPI000AC26E0F|nr:hypothetical protein [Infirmifilum uzonense]
MTRGSSPFALGGLALPRLFAELLAQPRAAEGRGFHSQHVADAGRRPPGGPPRREKYASEALKLLVYSKL